MSDPQQKLWSNNLNAPKVTYDLHLREKSNFAGLLIGSILYGMLIKLFFKCITSLFNPVYRRGECIKWGLVFYTIAMFSVVTVFTAANLTLQSISYIDNREFSGVNGTSLSGPCGYRKFIYSGAGGVILHLMFLLNGWLADGLLLYRCYIIFSTNLRVIAFPCFMYLSSLATGVMVIYWAPRTAPDSHFWFGLPYLSISLSLNVLLTIMIVIRLTLHTRTTRVAVGLTGMGGLYKAITTMLIESCSLYALSTLLVILPYVSAEYVMHIFFPILAETQVIAPLLIIQRVANKSALTSNTVTGRISSFKAGNRGTSMGSSGALPSGDSMSSVDDGRTSSCEFEVGIETTNDFYQDKV